MKSFLTKIIENKKIAKDIYKLTFACPPETIKGFKAGQFAHVKIPGRADLLLRRPFSLCSVDQKTDIATIIYQIAGEGTLALSQEKEGVLDVLLPLGNGFPANETYKRILLIGGGIGVAPLRSVIEQQTADFDAVLGYKSEPFAFFTHYFQRNCKNTVITTENGSMGHRGYVTDVIKDMDLKPYDAIYTCGPGPMLYALQFLLKRYSTPVYTSLEERMGCGMGGCAVCVCGIKAQDGLSYKKVCTEGPVFDLRKVDFT